MGQYSIGTNTWSDNGAYRVALHAATQAVIGGLAGGGSGAINSGAGVIGGNLGQQLGEQLGKEEAAKQGLTGEAASDLVNSYQQAGAAIGGALAGAAAGNGGSGALTAAIQGGTTAYSVDAYNRQLHQSEKDRIKQLAGKDAQKEARLTAAACAMVKCYAEYPIDSAAYQQLKQLAAIGTSDALAGERQQLSNQTGLFGYNTTGLFSDANIDSARQLNNTYQIDTRTLGAGQAVLGGMGVAGSVATAPVSCATGIGCVANAVVGTISLDAMYAGAKQTVSGNAESTFLNQGLQGLGMSPQAAGLVEAALGIGAAATASRTAAQVMGQSTNINAAASNGLRTSAAISAERAETFLVKNGMSVDRAADFVASFDGPITARLVRPGENFTRYTDVANSTGSFVTKTPFANPAAAIDGLYLGPYGNGASLMQSVTSTGRSIVLEGGVANGSAGVRQSVIINRGAFQFGTGLGY